MARSLNRQFFLVLDFHAFPESYVSLDLAGGRFGFGVVPGGTGVALAVDFDVVVTCGAFPGADRVLIAGFEMFVADGIGRKILIAFHFHGLFFFWGYCGLPG